MGDIKAVMDALAKQRDDALQALDMERRRVGQLHELLAQQTEALTTAHHLLESEYRRTQRLEVEVGALRAAHLVRTAEPWDLKREAESA